MDYREASDTCFFDASLDELAVKRGGKEPSMKWIEAMLKKQKSDGDPQLTAKVKQSDTSSGK